MPEQLKIILDAEVSGIVNGVKSASKVITSDFAKAAQSADISARSLTKSIALLENEFKSIGKIKIDYTDLDRIQSRLDSIKVRNINLDFELTGETGVNSAIESIKAKFAALKINPDLSAFNEIVSEINKLSGNEILLHVDNTDALNDITQIQKSLSNIKGEIIISGNIDQSLSGIRSKIQSLQSIDLKINPTDAILQINRIISEIVEVKNQEILLRADNSDAIAKINQLEGLAKDIRANIQINSTGLDSAKSQFFDLNKVANAALERINDGIDKMVDNALKGTTQIKTSFDKLGQGGFGNFQAALVKASTSIDQLQKRGQGINQFFAKVPSSANAAASSINKFSQASNEANFALLNVGRIAQDLPFGLIGIANNINPAVESFARLSQSAKETGVSVGSVLLKSLTGTGGLLFGVSLVTSALQFAAIGLSAFTRGFGGAKTEIDAATISLGQFNEKLAKTQSGIDNLKIGTAFRTDLKKITAEATGLEGEALDIFGLKESIKANNTLIKQVDKQADEIAKPLARINQGIEKIRDAQRFAIPASALKFGLTEAEAKKKFGDPILNVIDQFKDITLIPESALEGLEKADREIVDELIKLNKDIGSINKVREELVNQNELSILKIRVAANKQQERLDDEILKRARQFTKEFGETFVVPDLEETFFKGKKQLLPLAKKLLGDVSKGNLKIKIPVQADFELLPIEEPLSKEQLEELTKGFFSGIKAERGIPVDIVIDPSLSVDNIKLIKEKLKIEDAFNIFGDIGVKAFGKIDFSNINSGIKEATKLFADMKLVADTVAQSLSQGLTSAFDSVFDSILDGKNVFKALGDSIKALVVDMIKAIAKMLIIKAVTNLIFPGGGGIAGLLGGIGGVSNGGFGLGGSIAGRSFQNTLNVVVQGQISGQTILLAGQRAAGSNVR